MARMEAGGAENVSVCVRVRPLNERETAQGDSNVLEVSHARQIALHGNRYLYDVVFAADVATDTIYAESAQRIIQSALAGINGTIFAYGQTSSGKTFTMHGDDTFGERGILQLSIAELFSYMKNDETREYTLRASFAEIYNEVIHDLFGEEEEPNVIKIREDPVKGVFLECKEHDIHTPEDLYELLERGKERRAISATKMNDRSSRSHTICRLYIESSPKVEDEENTPSKKLVAVLNLVDLAGSESVRHTNAEGKRQREAGSINRSLLTLSRVIHSLAARSRHAQYLQQQILQLHQPDSALPAAPPSGSTSAPPYRDSKLTRLLQPSLGGNTRTLIICCVTPSSRYEDETRSTLQFASRAKSVQTSVHVNEVSTKEGNELEELKQALKDHGKRKQEMTQVLGKLLGEWKQPSKRRRLSLSPMHAKKDVADKENDPMTIDVNIAASEFSHVTSRRGKKLSSSRNYAKKSRSELLLEMIEAAVAHYGKDMSLSSDEGNDSFLSEEFPSVDPESFSVEYKRVTEVLRNLRALGRAWQLCEQLEHDNQLLQMQLEDHDESVLKRRVQELAMEKQTAICEKLSAQSQVERMKENVRTELAEVMEELQTLQGQFIEKEKENEELRKMVRGEVIDLPSEEVEREKREKETLKQLLDTKNQEAEELKKEVQQALLRQGTRGKKMLDGISEDQSSTWTNEEKESLEKDVASYKEMLSSVQSELQDSREEVKGAQEQLYIVTSEKEMLEQELQGVRLEKNKVEEKLAYALEEKDEMKYQLQELYAKDQASSDQDLQAQLEDSQHQLEESDERCRQLEALLSSQEEETRKMHEMEELIEAQRLRINKLEKVKMTKEAWSIYQRIKKERDELRRRVQEQEPEAEHSSECAQQ